MARRCSRATSRFIGQIHIFPRKIAAFAVWLGFYLLSPPAAEAGLYTASDQIILISPENVDSVLVNSTAAVVAEFYASWCGYCVGFSPVYKSLARDIKEWKPAVDLAAIDCAAEENRKVCVSYSIRGYPTIKFFHAYSKADSTGQTIRGFPRDVPGLRHLIIDNLETHKELWPPACPPLEPTSQAEIDSFFETNSVQYLALIFEEANSYVGREVTLDLLQFENIAVRRVLSTENDLVTQLGVNEFPSCYIYYPPGRGNFTRLKVNIEARTFYSYALQRLPGVVRSGKPLPVSTDVLANNTKEPWRSFNRSRVYMADLESTLHYSLRVEVAAHTAIKGEALISLKTFVAVLAKYFPGRTMVMNLLKSADSWLKNQDGEEISYEDFKGILENSAQSPDTALPEGERWVACQGSQPHLRRYPCGVWTLFHVLTVQAKNTEGTDPREVLSAMRNYIHSFFGCRYCAEHFENMASDIQTEVDSLSSAVQWLWSKHNLVNNRLTGALSEDPNFPKIQWPSPEMCSACHKVMKNGDHDWNKDEVHHFLLSYFSSKRILVDYLEDESLILAKQRERHATQQLAIAQKRVERKAREALDSSVDPPPSQPTVQEEGEEDEGEEMLDETVAEEEEEDVGEGEATADEIGGKTSEPTPWVKAEMDVSQGQWRIHRKPSIVGMRMRDMQEDIVDLDSFVSQHYKAKALHVAAHSRVKQRTLQRKEEQEPGPVFGLGMELDAGLGMVGLQPIKEDFDLDAEAHRKRLQKRELTGQYFDEELSHKGRWMSLLNIGFSKVDISLCVILYLLSSVCLLSMYVFFKNRFRLRRVKLAMP